jgi:hypothetical protein
VVAHRAAAKLGGEDIRLALALPVAAAPLGVADRQPRGVRTGPYRW